jgi:hypothetical protein
MIRWSQAGIDAGNSGGELLVPLPPSTGQAIVAPIHLCQSARVVIHIHVLYSQCPVTDSTGFG